MSAVAPPNKAELLGLFADIFDARTACTACGVVGEFERMGELRVCAACHAGCGVRGCRDAYGDGRSPIEARLWRLGRHAQAGDQGAARAFASALVEYERAAGPTAGAAGVAVADGGEE